MIIIILKQNINKKELQLKLTNEEYSYYNNIFETLDKNKIGYIDTKKADFFLKKSNLFQQILKYIWPISTHKTKGLNRNEFFYSIKINSISSKWFSLY